jgi:hypothetical protein
MKQILWILTFSISLLFCGTPLYSIVVDGKLGYIDSTGKVVIEPKFEYHPFFYEDEFPHISEGLVAFEKDSLFGFFDTLGNVVIEPHFTYACDFVNGFARVNVGGMVDDYGDGWLGVFGGKWGYINKKGSFIFVPQMEDDYEGIGQCVDDFTENRAGVTVYIDHKANTGFIDTLGDYLILPQFNYASSFNNGYARVVVGSTHLEENSLDGGKWGTIDKNGKYIIKPQFDYLSEFIDNIARVVEKFSNNTKWGLIDISGKYIVSPQFNYISDFHESLACILINANTNIYDSEVHEGPYDSHSSGGLWGYINPKGKISIFSQFFEAYNFSEGLARVGIVEEPLLSENISNDSIYHVEMYYPSLQRVYVKDNGIQKLKIYYGYIDKKGKYVISPQFDDASDFHNGYARIKVGNKWGIINKKGKFVISPTYDYLEDFSCGFAIANNGGYNFCDSQIDGDWFILGQNGKIKSIDCFSAEKFVCGIARVCIDTLQNKRICGYIDTLGNWVWKPTR